MAKWRHSPKTSAHRASAKAAQETFAAPQALTRTYQLPIGELPGTAFIELRTSDLLAHAWDLAIATGQPTDLDPDQEACDPRQVTWLAHRLRWCNRIFPEILNPRSGLCFPMADRCDGPGDLGRTTDTAYLRIHGTNEREALTAIAAPRVRTRLRRRRAGR